MSARWLPADEPFFREYNARRPGQRRSLRRAGELQSLWGLDEIAVPLLTVVGSKGKGTAAIFAAATLTAHGLRTGLVTSPSLRTNRERVRLDGQALDEDGYTRMSQRLDAALARLGPQVDGYLSPTGAYTVTALAELVRRGCDAIVLEEGLGGVSDEVSLFPPSVVAVTPIFAEHLDLLGPTVSDVADDLLGVVRAQTAAIVSSAQDEALAPRFALAARRARTDVTWCTAGHEEHLRPARGLSQANARVGIEAATRLLGLRSVPFSDASLQRLETVSLPGRLSDVPRGPTRWIVDAAIEERGAADALHWCTAAVGLPDLVILGMPDSKDVAGTLAVFDGLSVIGAKAGQTHLRYDSAAWNVPVVPWQEALERAHAQAAAIVLCVGTISFVAQLLEWLDVDCDRVY